MTKSLTFSQMIDTCIFHVWGLKKNGCKKVAVTELSLFSVPNAYSDLLSSSIDRDGRHEWEQSEWADGQQGHLQGFYWTVGHPLQQSQDQGKRTSFIVNNYKIGPHYRHLPYVHTNLFPSRKCELFLICNVFFEYFSSPNTYYLENLFIHFKEFIHQNAHM